MIDRAAQFINRFFKLHFHYSTIKSILRNTRIEVKLCSQEINLPSTSNNNYCTGEINSSLFWCTWTKAPLNSVSIRRIKRRQSDAISDHHIASWETITADKSHEKSLLNVYPVIRNKLTQWQKKVIQTLINRVR